MRTTLGAIALAILSLFLLSGCGLFDDSRKYEYGGVMEVRFDDSVPDSQVSQMKIDLDRFSQFRFTRLQQDDLQILGVNQLTAHELMTWLGRRMNYIVGEEFNWEDSTVLSQESHNGVPVVINAAESLDMNSPNRGKVVMLNLGALLYLEGRSNGAIFTLEVAGDDVRIPSPRVGIFAIGEALFTSRASLGGLATAASSFVRVLTLFHEGAHNDGHGNHVAFAHTKCPSGHALSGVSACENYLNGPYAKQYRLGQRIVESCLECTVAQKSGMNTILADIQGRILPGATFKDPSPETVDPNSIADVVYVGDE